MITRAIYQDDNKEIKLTNDQLEVLNSPCNTIIEGVAGSGKTLLAVLLAEKLIKEGFSVAVVVFTKALSKFIEDKINIPNVRNLLIDYEYQWNKKHGNYDYIIVDEFQDFSFQALNNIKKRANSGVYFFGDLKQKLYSHELGNKSVQTIDKKGLNELKLKRLYLVENFRVPDNIVNLLNDLYKKLANPQPYVSDGISVTPTALHEEKYLPHSKKDNNIKPEFYQFDSHEKEIDFISDVINKSEGKSIGILVVLNDEENKKFIDLGYLFGIGENQNVEKIPNIKDLAIKLSQKTKKPIGYKMHFEADLNFKNKENINILTVHSAKGLEFDVVVLPFVKANQHFVHPNSIYTAMTRCKEQLYITYSGYIQKDLKYVEDKLIEGTIKPIPDND